MQTKQVPVLFQIIISDDDESGLTRLPEEIGYPNFYSKPLRNASKQVL